MGKTVLPNRVFCDIGSTFIYSRADHDGSHAPALTKAGHVLEMCDTVKPVFLRIAVNWENKQWLLAPVDCCSIKVWANYVCVFCLFKRRQKNIFM